MTREDQVERILDELEEEFAKANMPVNDKLTLFAKVSNAIYKCAEQESCTEVISRFDGMTNGEVMETVFPKAKVGRHIDEYERPSDYLIYIDDETYFTKEWWNAPYKGGAEC